MKQKSFGMNARLLLAFGVVAGLAVTAGCGTTGTADAGPTAKPMGGSAPATAVSSTPTCPAAGKIAGMPAKACSAEGSCEVPASHEPITHGAMHQNEGCCGGPNPAPEAPAKASLPVTAPAGIAEGGCYVTKVPEAAPEMGDGCCATPVASGKTAATPVQAGSAQAKTVSLDKLEGAQPSQAHCCGGGLIEACPPATAVVETPATGKAAVVATPTAPVETKAGSGQAEATAVQKQANPNVDVVPAEACPSCAAH